MKEKVKKILIKVNEEIKEYSGENMLEDGVIDSFEILEIVSELEEVFNIELEAKHVVEENFKTVDDIVELVKALTKE